MVQLSLNEYCNAQCLFASVYLSTFFTVRPRDRHNFHHSSAKLNPVHSPFTDGWSISRSKTTGKQNRSAQKIQLLLAHSVKHYPDKIVHFVPRAKSGVLRTRDPGLWPDRSQVHENVRGLCKTELYAELRTLLFNMLHIHV